MSKLRVPLSDRGGAARLKMSDAETESQCLHDQHPELGRSTSAAGSPSGGAAEDRLAARAPGSTGEPRLRARAESNSSQAGFARHDSSASSDFSWYRTGSASSVASAQLGNRVSLYNEAAAGITLEVAS